MNESRWRLVVGSLMIICGFLVVNLVSSPVAFFVALGLAGIGGMQLIDAFTKYRKSRK